MNRELETELRGALAVAASRVPGDAGERLRGVDYHPRSTRLPPRLTLGALAGVAVTSGAVASVVVLAGSQAAFAGWSPAPTASVSKPASAADATCRARLASSPALAGSAAGAWAPVATDVRGPFTLVIYENGSSDATCFTGPSISVVSQSSVSGGSESGSSSVRSSGGPGHVGVGSSVMVGGSGTGDLEHVSLAHFDSVDGAYTLAEGRVASGVSAVGIVRSDGVHVETTLGDGWFVAWWPGSEGVAAALLTTAGGTATQPLHLSPLAPPPPPGAGTCTPAPAPSVGVACSSGGTGSQTVQPPMGGGAAVGG